MQHGWDYRVRVSPCGYEAHQLNSWYESKLKRAVSLVLTEEKRANIVRQKSNSTSNIRSILSTTNKGRSFFILKFHLWHRKDEKVSVALDSCSLLDTAAVQVLYCLTEKTGLHQDSLEVKHRHRQMESVNDDERRIEVQFMLVKDHTHGFIQTYFPLMLTKMFIDWIYPHLVVTDFHLFQRSTSTALIWPLIHLFLSTQLKPCYCHVIVLKTLHFYAFRCYKEIQLLETWVSAAELTRCPCLITICLYS